MARFLTDFSLRHKEMSQKTFFHKKSPNGMSQSKDDIKLHLLIQELCHNFVSCST